MLIAVAVLELLSHLRHKNLLKMNTVYSEKKLNPAGKLLIEMLRLLLFYFKACSMHS